MREFDSRSKHFLFSNHFINSHNLISWQGVNKLLLGENWCWSPLGLKGLSKKLISLFFCVWKLPPWYSHECCWYIWQTRWFCFKALTSPCRQLMVFIFWLLVHKTDQSTRPRIPVARGKLTVSFDSDFDFVVWFLGCRRTECNHRSVSLGNSYLSQQSID